MRPITRETIIDRRQPLLRWSAVFAGAAISIALWVLLQTLGMGIGLAAVDLDDAGSLRDIGIGTTVWTAAAPMIAMFIGGLIAGRMAGTHARGVGATHGFVVWALTSLLGLCALVFVVTLLADGGMRMAAADLAPLPQQPGQHEVAEAAIATSQILLGVGIAMAVSLLTAVLGGLAGVTKRIRREPRELAPEDRQVVIATPPAP